MLLTDNDRRELLRIARTTLKEYLSCGHIPPGKPHKASLLTPAAVFVSLHDGETLRGCIGTTESKTPLYRAVQEMAVAAATRDPRFDAVLREELDDLDIEVSVLHDKTAFKSLAELRIGVHGLAITSGGRRGLLLPQVAAEHHWDAQTFLLKTCEKAGLGANEWQQPGVVAETFFADVFSESSMLTSH